MHFESMGALRDLARLRQARFWAGLCLCIPFIASAAAFHEVVLGPRDTYELSETADWRFEVLKEQHGAFTDVRFKPQRGEDFSLTLYFLADPADRARLDTPEKIAASVMAGGEPYLPLIVEKKITVQALAPRRSFGSLIVLTAAAYRGMPGEFKYQTRGMVRLSPDAALGFSLLSREINTPAYRQALTHVYSFIRMAPAAAPAAIAPANPIPPPPSAAQHSAQPGRATAGAPAPAPRTVPAPSQPAAPTPATASQVESRTEPAPRAERPATPASTPGPAPRPVKPAGRGPGRDLRECLRLPTDAEIMRCASGGR